MSKIIDARHRFTSPDEREEEVKFLSTEDIEAIFTRIAIEPLVEASQHDWSNNDEQ